MGLLNRLLDTFSGKDDENYDNDEVENYEDEEEEENYENAPAERQPRQEAKPMEEKQEKNASRRQHEQPQTRTYQNQGGRASVEMKVVKPNGKYEAGYTIGEHIIKGRTVIINFEETPKDMQTRIMDFIFGLCYATNASVKNSSTYTYIISPVNVQVSTDAGPEEDEGEGEEEQYNQAF
ncbi:MAG: cell division protein SepF [Clostridia bacterium]|nr:cell division protein SepF [Clostridia bacterium]